MILQVNQRGGWREVAELENHQLRQVTKAAAVLARALSTGITDGSKAASFRIVAVRGRSPKVIAHIKAIS